ncbi:FISUMP domain-containing protein [Fluviicola sp.]|jgi:uncharacterized protein (TIGR02145 family)|uniref:FISUMP domain-containing protein n=1 Tax=Fluviicola sp. TaxID=1917219 RepID=UPI0028303BB8|nr:FISUMP domain-containing protein [Fluviicola sp.]MDR0802795.1 fibrobacter succinogenes major paralogous domain-containing protein [Fluviicola sp.]
MAKRKLVVGSIAACIFALCANMANAQVVGTPYTVPYNAIIEEQTTYTDVMYDFQHQTIQAYNVSGTAYVLQWQVSTDTTVADSFIDIPGANAQNYTIPAYYIDGFVTTEQSKELFFRVIANNGTKEDISSIMGILFIRTNTPGYGIDTTGVHYLTINMGLGGVAGGGTVKIALLNLGQSGTGSLNTDPLYSDAARVDDAADLGDFYQWGRVADGQQHTVWSKTTAHVNQINPMTGGGSATSKVGPAPVPPASYPLTPVLDATGQVDPSDPYYGLYIPGTGSWGNPAVNVWGNTSIARAGAPASLAGWSFPQNNPCPNGWFVPSLFDWADMFQNNGTGNLTAGTLPVTANGNTWEYRGTNAQQAIGGVIITNNTTGEKVYLPTTGSRHQTSGGLQSLGSLYYWSSTSGGNPNLNATRLTVIYNATTGVTTVAGDGVGASRSTGMCVRCIQKP